MPTHTTDHERTVLIGVSADNADMLAAIRAAASESRLVRLHGVTNPAAIARVAALAEGYGWSPTFRFPRVEWPDIVDLHLGSSL